MGAEQSAAKKQRSHLTVPKNSPEGSSLLACWLRVSTSSMVFHERRLLGLFL
ncbi:hypothetical protein HG15A2_36120 [Adhaeretor mobilis]|uniref:Uncharacterized protein n=1 Tax=Adhaeretor mobilis TaxID=1930276 RepID=A0A517MZG0_9BACT|nr:hypothetical protein HG15A2_36120 [Adhaeretor mobilis]